MKLNFQRSRYHIWEFTSFKTIDTLANTSTSHTNGPIPVFSPYQSTMAGRCRFQNLPSSPLPEHGVGVYAYDTYVVYVKKIDVAGPRRLQDVIVSPTLAAFVAFPAIVGEPESRTKGFRRVFARTCPPDPSVHENSQSGFAPRRL